MGMKHIPDGQDFSHRDFPADFGFSGSTQHAHPRGRRPTAPVVNPDEPADTPNYHGDTSMAAEAGHGNAYAHGGHVHPHGHDVVSVEHHEHGVIHHHGHGGYSLHHKDGHVTHHSHTGSEVHHEGHEAHGGHVMAHPHGHRVTHTETRHDGAEVHHHDHGGYSVHHVDGHVSHHHHDGAPAHHGMNGVGGTAHEYAHGGESDMAQDKAMVRKGIRQHEDHEHGGEHTDLELARGGITGSHVRLPRKMLPPTARMHSPIGGGMPINRPPRTPKESVTKRNTLPGGQMGYGVEPSAEPDVAGSDQTGLMGQLHRGGRARHRG